VARRGTVPATDPTMRPCCSASPRAPSAPKSPGRAGTARTTLGLVAGRAHLPRVQGGRLSVQASPASGCAFWKRVPVADEVPGAPAGYRDAVVGAGGVRTGLLRSLPRPAHSFI